MNKFAQFENAAASPNILGMDGIDILDGPHRILGTAGSVEEQISVPYESHDLGVSSDEFSQTYHPVGVTPWD
jgi:hypothetical protein